MTHHCHLRPNVQKCPAPGNLPDEVVLVDKISLALEEISGTDRALSSIAWISVIPAHGGKNRRLFGRAETCTDGGGRIAKRGAKQELIKNFESRMAFLEDVFAKVRDSIGGRRKTGNRQKKGVIGSLFTLRDLQREIEGEA